MGDSRDIPVIIVGSNSMASSFEVLVRHDDRFQGDIITVESVVMKNKAGYGAIKVAKEHGIGH